VFKRGSPQHITGPSYGSKSLNTSKPHNLKKANIERPEMDKRTAFKDDAFYTDDKPAKAT